MKTLEDLIAELDATDEVYRAHCILDDAASNHLNEPNFELLARHALNKFPKMLDARTAVKSFRGDHDRWYGLRSNTPTAVFRRNPGSIESYTAELVRRSDYFKILRSLA